MSVDKRARLAAGVLACMFSIHCGSDVCLQLAQQYADELPNALACDPNSNTDQCGDAIFTADYLANGQQMTLDGLSTCLHSANPANDAKLKDILSQFQGAGCKPLAAPVCPQVVDRCYVNDQGKGVCFL
jgi:hypothetical protein